MPYGINLYGPRFSYVGTVSKASYVASYNADTTSDTLNSLAAQADAAAAAATGNCKIPSTAGCTDLVTPALAHPHTRMPVPNTTMKSFR